MATTPTFTITAGCDCNTLVWTDTTGLYDASTNTTGWGNNDGSDPATHMEAENVDTAVLTITFPDATTTTVSVATEIIASTPGTSDATKTITLTDLGLSSTTVLDAGSWSFSLVITDTSEGLESTSATLYKLIYCEYEICMDNRMINMDLTSCAKCIRKNEETLLSMRFYLERLKNAAEINDDNSFAQIQKLLNKYCSATSNCKCN